MRTSGIVSLGLLALRASLATACGDHAPDDGKVWSKEELDELESKWGIEVSLSLSLPCITSPSCIALHVMSVTVVVAVCHAPHLILPQACSPERPRHAIFPILTPSLERVLTLPDNCSGVSTLLHAMVQTHHHGPRTSRGKQ